jgi:hypothetical protein
MTSSTALLTDRYELTMLQGALADGTAGRRCVFEVFTRRLPHGRRYGVLAGTGRVLEALADFRFGPEELGWLSGEGVVDDVTLAYLADYRFTGTIHGYAEGEMFFPQSPVLTVEGTFAEAVLLETVVLSILNYDSAIASAASRMTNAAIGRPVLEMGARRAHEQAAVAAARAAAVAGFAGTSNLEAGRRYGLPTIGTAAHAFTLLHDDEEAAFAAQVASSGAGTTLLVDTYDVRRGVERAVAAAGTGLGAVRLDSGDLGVLAQEVGHSWTGSAARHEDRRHVRPRRVRDRRAGRRAGRLLRRRHLAGHRLRGADLRHSLQARRPRGGRRGARPGGEGVGREGLGRRPEVGGAPAGRDRARGRGGRGDRRGRRGTHLDHRAPRTCARCGCRWSSTARCSPAGPAPRASAPPPPGTRRPATSSPRGARRLSADEAALETTTLTL